MSTSPLQVALGDLAQRGYEVVHVCTFPTSPEAPEPHHVYAVGRTSNRHVIIVREGGDGTYRFYVPVRGDLGQQVSGMIQWLEDNAGPAAGG
jgi:hypothetical protein